MTDKLKQNECDNCGTKFFPRVAAQRFCSTKCRSEYHRAHSRTCEMCGTVTRSANMMVYRPTPTEPLRLCNQCDFMLGKSVITKEAAALELSKAYADMLRSLMGATERWTTSPDTDPDTIRAWGKSITLLGRQLASIHDTIVKMRKRK